MNRFLMLLLLGAVTPLVETRARAAEKLAPPPTPAAQRVAAGELGLEGTVQSIDEATGQITLLATAFSTPAGRKILAPPKTKVVAAGKTRFFDGRTRRDSALSALENGVVVRVIGRDAGAGKPLAARLLVWRSVDKSEPPDPDTPAVLRALMPTSQGANGVRVRVFDAGFESEKKLFKWGRDSTPTFFLAFRTLAPAGEAPKKPGESWSRFVGLTAPDGGLLNGSGYGEHGQIQVGRAITFPRVDPRWKSVTATWEVVSPDAPADASGEFEGNYEVTVEAPSPEKPRVEPKKTFQTAHGFTYTLESVTSDFEKKTTFIVFRIEKPADAPDARISTTQDRVRDDKGTYFMGGTTNQEGTFLIRSNTLPAAGAKTISVGLHVEESAPGWKKQEFFQFVNIEVPVAALAKAKPPTLSTSAAPVYLMQNEAMEARLEEAQRGESRWHGTLWVRSKTPTGAPRTPVEKLINVSGGQAVTSDGRNFKIIASSADRLFFRSDGSAPAPDERAFSLQIDIRGAVPDEPVKLELQTSQTPQLRHVANSPRFALPALDAPVSLAPPKSDSLKTGTLRLQKVARLEGKSASDIALRTGGGAQAPATGALALVFGLDAAFPESSFALQNFALSADNGAVTNRAFSSWKGDALSDSQTGKAWTLIALSPTPNAKSLKLQLELLETGARETAPVLTIEGVALKPVAKTAETNP